MTLDDLIRILTAIREAEPACGELVVYRHDSPLEITPVRTARVEVASPDDEIDDDQIILLD